jgi:hypothetical protein
MRTQRTRQAPSSIEPGANQLVRNIRTRCGKLIEATDLEESMENLSADNLHRLFAAVGARLAQPSELYLLGGGALVLLGSPRRTGDLDFVGRDVRTGQQSQPLQTVLEQVSIRFPSRNLTRFTPVFRANCAR